MSDWDRLLEIMLRYDDRTVSDEARRWADADVVASGIDDPAVRGALRAALETAFDAGRTFEVLRRGRA